MDTLYLVSGKIGIGLMLLFVSGIIICSLLQGVWAWVNDSTWEANKLVTKLHLWEDSYKDCIDSSIVVIFVLIGIAPAVLLTMYLLWEVTIIIIITVIFLYITRLLLRVSKALNKHTNNINIHDNSIKGDKTCVNTQKRTSDYTGIFQS